MKEQKKELDIYPFIELTSKSTNPNYENKFKFNTLTGAIRDTTKSAYIYYPSESDGDGGVETYDVKESLEEIAIKIDRMNAIHFRHRAEIERDVNEVNVEIDPAQFFDLGGTSGPK